MSAELAVALWGAAMDTAILMLLLDWRARDLARDGS